MALLLVWSVAPTFAQSQAINATVEGTITDASGAALPGVTVTVSNVDTGETRVVVSNEGGVYRAPLLGLGRYRVSAELQGFKKFEQQGLSLSAGQTAVINFALSVGNLSETVTVTAETPIAEPGKIDMGRTISETEIKNLPLVSRNPYNFAFLQANVTGYENNEFGVPRINANGSQMHTNYQLDGNTNTEKDRAGLRMLPVSEVLVREVKVITNGFAPEFGQTTGMVYNAITPSGTNIVHGSASFRFKRNAMSSSPFFLASTARKPDTEANDFTAALGGPIRKDKWHFYGAYEYVDRSLVTGGSVITVSAADAQQLGITLPSSGVIPAHQKVNFGFGKSEYQLSPGSLLSVRYFGFKNFSASNIGAGGFTTTDRATDFTDRMDSTAAQLVSTVGRSMLNELRVQYARRHQFRTQGISVDGPGITVSGRAAFGGARLGDDNSVGFDFNQGISQVIDNVSWIRGKHALKTGIDAQWIKDERVRGDLFLYTFPTIPDYLAAKNGTNPFSYTNFQQLAGDLTASYDSAFYGLFVQDDWQVASRLKVLFGFRYDLFDVPAARPFAANRYSQDFTIDKNNIGPRAGVSWAVDQSARTVVRASVGLMYEPPLLNFYDAAILSNGDPKSYNIGPLAPNQVGAPAFPASLAAPPPGFVLPKQSIGGVDTEFRTQSAWLSNVQVERALSSDIAVTLGYVNSIGRNLPVLIDVNLVPSGTALSDGRQIFSTARLDPNFDHINLIQSIGDSTYNAFTATLTKRMTHGWLTQATYTLARGVDNAPLGSAYIIGSGDDRPSDPTDLDRDRGVTPYNQTHTLSVSTVVAPTFGGDGFGSMLANHNQVGFILQANSGLPFNLRSNLDLNKDTLLNDRPVGVERNAGRLGRVINLDLRYSRFVPVRAEQRLELFFEAKNLFNTQNISAVNRVITTDAFGGVSGPIVLNGRDLPTAGKSGYDQRTMQLGFKFAF
ncbi:MAG: TonB-dependent receptor [Acidobacteriota bacterium]